MAMIGRRSFVAASMAGAAMLAGRGLGAVPRRTRPNIVFVLADDMGWGDIAAYNRNSAVPTPRLDRLAGQGMRFTDMHSASAVCTPSRYAILTGRYPWRSRLKKGVLGGNAPSLIEDGRLTLPGLLQRAGYRTAGVGKWHLGLGAAEAADFTRPFHPAPTDHGFDFFYGIPASLDLPPYLYFENDHAVAPPTASTPGQPESERGVFWRAGAMMPGFDFAQVVPTLTQKAVGLIDRYGRDRRSPFFLYFALPSPHTPWLPQAPFRGTSRAGLYGDYVNETDAMVGRVLDALDRNGLTDDTIVIFASDNGADWHEEDIDRYPHRANAGWRGRKADIWEAGHRVPCLVRWPGHVRAGAVSAETASLTDWMATLASLLALPLPDDAAEDSFDLSPALAGANRRPIRASLIEESNDGVFAIREGAWKLELGLGSGGFTRPAHVEPAPGGVKGQLYDLTADPGETANLWDRRPDLVARLTDLLRRQQEAGRTRP